MKRNLMMMAALCGALLGPAAPGLAAQTHEHQQSNPSSASPTPGQKTAMPGMQMNGEGHSPEQPSGPALTLEMLEQMALDRNPTLKQAEAELRAAEGRKRQAGLYPNPTVGYQGQEIRGGSFRGGEHGVFVQQEIVLGGKLGASKSVFEQERRQAEVEREEQRLRVMNGVTLAYYQSLAAQETVELRASLLKVAQDAAQTARQLFNVGQSDEPDVLQAEIEMEEVEQALVEAQQNQQQRWKALASMTGNPDLPFSVLAGNLENVPDLNPEQWLQAHLTESPAVKIAELGVTRAEAVVTRARREPIPDLQVRGGMEQNRELLETSGRPAGLQGFVELGIRVPLFNRNQGNIQAAKAEAERARHETQRVQLMLRERLAATVQSYLTAKVAVDRYRNRMIPRAEKAYAFYRQKYSSAAAAYPQVLIAQRTVLQLRADYIRALETLWMNTVVLKGFMLTDGLEMPTPPGEMDRSIRETSMPQR
ncbi:MAG TPA: TolC family protein [Candidatus Saccharimonadales bacterium]|jgi:cobalt-zinc-cadmium efflux system outer membrane protein|nr:TolC family protein [Candidatus Saccharimonadales bacterium]